MDTKVRKRTPHQSATRKVSQARTHWCLLFEGTFWQSFEVRGAININFGKAPKQTTRTRFWGCVSHNTTNIHRSPYIY